MSSPHSASTVLQPGQYIKPKITMAQATSLVERLYGFTVGHVSELNSYDDRNFLFTVKSKEQGSNIDDDLSKKYIFKVLNSMDSQKIHVGEGL